MWYMWIYKLYKYICNVYMPRDILNHNISSGKGKSTITENLSSFIETFETWCSKHGMNKSTLLDWKSNVIDKVDEKKYVQKNFFKVLYEYTSPKQPIKYFEWYS